MYASLYRTIVLARRILHKDQERREIFYDNLGTILGNLTKNPKHRLNITGPAHGFVKAAVALGIQIHLHDGDVILQMPSGERVSLFTRCNTHLVCAVKDAIRFSILQHLSERVGVDGANGGDRRDMKGITPWVDFHYPENDG